MSTSRNTKLVKIAYHETEPWARLGESRLKEAGIPCLLRSKGVGPGAFGVLSVLPYSLWVRQEDEAAARDVLSGGSSDTLL
ncbi:MAG: hypothetical protein EXR67_06925 [Dehalococcoidia bacterium]|nr:hypothetical protein [Dehalococcoidia bacterium]